MAPVASPVLSPHPLQKQRSSASVKSFTSSSSSLLLPEGPVEPVKAEGLRHAWIRLEARHYKTQQFAAQVQKVVASLQIASWADKRIRPEDILTRRISGALTNAVFFVSCKVSSKIPTLLLRIYGPSSGVLISRPTELHILHKLSSVYGIGPRVYGTFENGRLEEYFESTTLTADDIRDPVISRWIGARMAEFHSVDVDVVSPPSGTSAPGMWEASVKQSVSSWLTFAYEVLAFPSLRRGVSLEIDLPRFEKEWKIYLKWISRVEDRHSGSSIVLGHNDAQYGNLLRLTNTLQTDEHRQIIVVDFEYAGPNPAAYDIANHFHEWTANYHNSSPHRLSCSLYPSFTQRRNFYTSYVQHSNLLVKGAQDPVFDSSDLDQLIAALDYQVRVWSPASHAMWAIWGIVQAREDVQNNAAEPEFDYIGYSKGRMDAFRREILELGVIQR